MTPDTLEEAVRLRIARLRMMIFDVDGVLTDGRIIYLDDGSEIKVFDVQDGHGIKLLQRAGFRCIAVWPLCRLWSNAKDWISRNTGRKVNRAICHSPGHGLKDEEVGFMGDVYDIP